MLKREPYQSGAYGDLISRSGDPLFSFPIVFTRLSSEAFRMSDFTFG
jgi:hypothetical protein